MRVMVRIGFDRVTLRYLTSLQSFLITQSGRGLYGIALDPEYSLNSEKYSDAERSISCSTGPKLTAVEVVPNPNNKTLKSRNEKINFFIQSFIILYSVTY